MRPRATPTSDGAAVQRAVEGRAAAPERVAPYGEVSGQRRVDMKFGQTHSDALERAKNRQNDQH